MVEATRELNDQVSTELRHYISSLAPDAKQAAEVVRSHWGIENSSHWVLDVAFREDDSRVRVGKAADFGAHLDALNAADVERWKTFFELAA